MAAYCSLVDFEAYHPPAAGSGKSQDILDLAGDAVERYAPPPDPAEAEYTERRVRAEKFVAEYLFETGAYKGSVSRSLDVLRRSTNFDAAGEGVRKIVRETMGTYYRGGLAKTALLRRG